MSEDRFHNDATFLVAAYYAGQMYADAQHANKVNAYVSRGYTIDDANTIVRVWYAAYSPRRWNPGAWQLVGIGWVVVNLLALRGGDSAGAGGYVTAFAFVLAGWFLIQLRVRYCAAADQRSLDASVQAQSWLAERGL
jgi:hypothetical protein